MIKRTCQFSAIVTIILTQIYVSTMTGILRNEKFPKNVLILPTSVLVKMFLWKALFQPSLVSSNFQVRSSKDWNET